jgi:hypothetical protein
MKTINEEINLFQEMLIQRKKEIEEQQIFNEEVEYLNIEDYV